ncbi:MAG: AMP-binding protein [Bacteroidaceae bacterium]|nr:AMP-binding protein [Bacteroidaceae bacterium]
MIKDFQKSAIIVGDRNVSYSEMLQRIHLFSQYTKGEKGDRVLILSENREGWIYAFFSVWARQEIATPVDAGSTAHDVAYIIKDCRPTCVWTSRTKVDLVREAVNMAGIDVEILLIDDYELAPVSGEKAVIESRMEDTALIIYTSGTTGSPKGVMLSFANIEANIRSVSDDVPIFNTERCTLILLPLHHVLPLVGSMVAPITKGGGVAICPSMSGPDIMETLCRGKVAIMIGVPRLWQTLYLGIKKKIDANAVTRFLFWLCAKAGSPALSKTIFKSVHKKMGGHITYCVCGGASLDKEIGEGLRTLGLDVLEGYGMTEAAPMISFTRPGDIIPGCAGLPLPTVECKIVNDELWAKGPNIMQGYYNRPEETAEVLDKDGFLHTGDLARFDEKGRIYITGRSKEIIVLSNGKNVQPAEIEFQLEQYPVQVKEAAVVQDGDLLKAIIVPQPEWAGEKNDEQLETELKREVLEPFNRTVANYKKVMGVFVYRGDLPRTRLDKLQRFKLKEIVEAGSHRKQKVETDC